MLYYIAILIIFLVLAYACIVLFKKFGYFKKRKEELQMRESDFLDKLYTERELQPDQSFKMGAYSGDGGQ